MIEVTATIHLLRTEAGGRKSFILSGYRPNIRFGEDLYADGAITFSDREKLFPGDKWNVKILFPRPESVRAHLTTGNTFYIHEGMRKVGEGKILCVEDIVTSPS